jgi:hypothetical protein
MRLRQWDRRQPPPVRRDDYRVLRRNPLRLDRRGAVVRPLGILGQMRQLRGLARVLDRRDVGARVGGLGVDGWGGRGGGGLTPHPDGGGAHSRSMQAADCEDEGLMQCVGAMLVQSIAGTANGVSFDAGKGLKPSPYRNQAMVTNSQ